MVTDVTHTAWTVWLTGHWTLLEKNEFCVTVGPFNMAALKQLKKLDVNKVNPVADVGLYHSLTGSNLHWLKALQMGEFLHNSSLSV